MTYLETIRLKELNQAAAYMPRGAEVLEIGGGKGWQARELERLGFKVSSIDVPESGHRSTRIWPVQDYDGHKIPFPDASFDIIFSSNVLEHIPHVESFQMEIHRVLRPGGAAIHLLPSGTWRLWTNVMHYPFLILYALRLLLRRESKVNPAAMIATKGKSKGWFKLAALALWAQRHGELGGPITEIYYFSRFRWQRLFKNSGWRIESHTTNKLCYSGYLVFGHLLSLSCRNLMSRTLGSTCHLYVLRDSNQA